MLMKRILLPGLLIATLPLFQACSSDADELPVTEQAQFVTPSEDYEVRPEFPEADNSTMLSSTNGAKALCDLVKVMEPSRALQLGETRCTDAQFAEIKAYVDANLKGATGEETYKNIFAWIRANLKYSFENAYLDPYDVFIHKTCVCQGYANLLKTMMLTQDLPAFGVNGQLVGVGAHAWNYVHDGEKWWVSDPTNGNEFEMTKYRTYQDRLAPQRADLDLFEDEYFGYGFVNDRLNINRVKKGAPEMVTLPYSVAGYRISCFDPQEALPEDVRVLCLGKNIVALSLYESSLREYTPGVEEVYVDEANTYFETLKGVLYRKKATTPSYIPTAMKTLELKMTKVMGKNAIYDLPYVEEIIIPEGTETVEACAIEHCPSLKRVNVSATVTSWDENALWRCPEGVEINIIPTDLREVWM